MESEQTTYTVGNDSESFWIRQEYRPETMPGITVRNGNNPIWSQIGPRGACRTGITNMCVDHRWAAITHAGKWQFACIDGTVRR